ncbi:DUF421 domain-containing protein [Pseudonocardia sp. TMWB2A]|uniref:DUF421 domain-containing protein n=1 Tax=Pseudonocardia sp. TMWB2A TaxID=687430 RepID=UPI00307D31D6
MDIVLRAGVMFAILYCVIRLMGKRELAQLTPFELVTLMVLGDLAQQAVTHSDTSLTGGLLAIATFAFLASALSWITFKSRRAEKLLDGTPQVIVRNGQLLKENLKRDRVTVAEVESQMRLAGISRIDQIAYAIIEPQGPISFIRKDGDELNAGHDPTVT